MRLKAIDYATYVYHMFLLQIGSIRRHKGTILQLSASLLDINHFNGWL
jgi:hypothetical protein